MRSQIGLELLVPVLVSTPSEEEDEQEHDADASAESNCGEERHSGVAARDFVEKYDIEWLTATGITSGCSPPVNDEFCPNSPVTRGQIAAFLVRALGYTDDGSGDVFVDDDGPVFEAQIDMLATAEVTRGCNPPVNDRCRPTSKCDQGADRCVPAPCTGHAHR